MARHDLHPAIRDGLQIIAALHERGVQVSLRADGTPAASPRGRLRDEDLALLKEHRDLVIVALGYEAAVAGREVG